MQKDKLQHFHSMQQLFVFKTSPAEKMLALNLMINMLGQNTDKTGKTLLDQNVYSIAEVLVITLTNTLPNQEQMLQLVECYDNESMTKYHAKRRDAKNIRRLFSEILNSKRQIDVEANFGIEICCTAEGL